MALFRSGIKSSYFGTHFYIDKSVWYGWKEINWWEYSKEGREYMRQAINRLVSAGHTVI